MARFALFKVPGELRNILVNLESIDWVGSDDGRNSVSFLHMGNDHVMVEASISSVQSLLEMEWGNVLDGTPDA